MKTTLVDDLVEKYGNITAILDIQLKEGEYYITAKTEKANIVYFETGGGYDDYKYSPESHSWSEHEYGGLSAKRFRETPIEKTVNESKPHGIRAKFMFKKYGKLLSIRVTEHWKYLVRAEIKVEKKDKPIQVQLSRWFDEYGKINTLDVSWDALMGEDIPPYIFDSDDDDSSSSDDEQ